MRIWNVNPKFMCDVHLVAEHREAHMLAGALAKGVHLEGHVARGLIEPGATCQRHDLLADEMEARGFQHRSPMGQILQARTLPNGFICELVSWRELERRCEWCRLRGVAAVYVPIHPPHTCDEGCRERTMRDEAARPTVAGGIAKERPRPSRRHTAADPSGASSENQDALNA
jgi:hypothetical protein